MRTVAFGAILLVASAAGNPALGAPVNSPLRPWQVVCAERQLARVQRRMISYGSPTIVGANAGASPLGYGRLALWHESTTGGIFSGLARIVDLGAGVFFDFQSGQEHFAEQDLAFDLLVKPAAVTLDPRQPRIPQATLARRDAGTNLSLDHPGCYPMNATDGDLTCPAILSLDLSAVAGDPTHPGTALVINSASGVAPGLSGPGAQPLAVATGTGEGILAGRLAEACGGTLTDFDHRVFEILARTLLPSECFWRPDAVPCDEFGDFFGFNMTIFRGTDPHVYRVDVYEYTNAICNDDGSCDYGSVGPLALEFRMEWDAVGRLTVGTASVLPVCGRSEDVGCTSPNALGEGIFVLPPVFPGHQEQQPAAFRNAPLLTISGFDPRQSILSVRIHWADLLKSTALNSP